MKLAAAVKVRRAQEVVVNVRPFSESLVEILYNANSQLQTEDVDTPLTKVRPVKKVALVVPTGDRGLYGAFNNHGLKKAEMRIEEFKELGLDYTVVSVARKGNTYFQNRPYIPVDKFLDGSTLRRRRKLRPSPMTCSPSSSPGGRNGLHQVRQLGEVRSGHPQGRDLRH